MAISPSMVCRVITKLKSEKSTGPNGWPIEVIKQCSQQISIPLSIIFNKSFQSGVLPQDWKVAYITPIHKTTKCLQNSSLPKEWLVHCITPVYKSGSKELMTNYRPISLPCIVSKILERLVYNKIMPFLLNSFSTYQFGFLPKRSTTQQLLLVLNTIHKAIHTSKAVDILYLDFRKAFDTVSHGKLLGKLWSIGIRGNLWQWFKAYLSNRQQCVKINNNFSSMLPVISGVPQGSILGPLLFAVFINDLPNCVSSSTSYLFADDTKCLKVISNQIDIQILQEDLDNLSNWSHANKLLFNESKSTHLHFGKKFGFHTYTLNGSDIATTDCIKDLGIYLSTNINFRRHYEKLIAGAYRMLGLLRRTFTTYLCKKTIISNIGKITGDVFLPVVASIPIKRYQDSRTSSKKSNQIYSK